MSLSITWERDIGPGYKAEKTNRLAGTLLFIGEDLPAPRCDRPRGQLAMPDDEKGHRR